MDDAQRMEEAMEEARRCLRDRRPLDAVVVALAAVKACVKPDPARLQELQRAGYGSVCGGRAAVERWLAGVPRAGTLEL